MLKATTVMKKLKGQKIRTEKVSKQAHGTEKGVNIRLKSRSPSDTGSYPDVQLRGSCISTDMLERRTFHNWSLLA